MRALKGNFAWSVVQTDKELILLFEEDARVNQIPFRAEHKKHQSRLGTATRSRVGMAIP